MKHHYREVLHVLRPKPVNIGVYNMKDANQLKVNNWTPKNINDCIVYLMSVWLYLMIVLFGKSPTLPGPWKLII